MSSSLSFYIITRLLGGNEMVDLYVALIIRGRRTFEQIPLTMQPAVAAELNALGLGLDGKPLPIEV